MSYQPKYIQLLQTGLPVLSTINYRELAKIGKLDAVLTYSLSLTPTLLNSNAGKSFVLFNGKSNQRYRIISVSGKTDAAMAVLGGGLTVELRHNATVKAAINLTAAIAAATTIPLSTTPNGVASAAGENITFGVVGAGSVSSTTPISVQIQLVQEPS